LKLKNDRLLTKIIKKINNVGLLATIKYLLLFLIKFPKRVSISILYIKTPHHILYYYNFDNFGDALNKKLISSISSEKTLHYRETLIFRRPLISVIGSIIDNNRYKNYHVWGSGFLSATSNHWTPPQIVYFVRGPLTRERLIKFVDVPKIYGDPALLAPLVFKPIRTEEFDLGIIPHYIHKKSNILKSLVEKYSSTNKITIIDVNSDPEIVIEQINKCRVVLSSSLHGLIISDAYKVPSRLIMFSDSMILNDFKFKDYFLGVKKTYLKPLLLEHSSNLLELISEIKFTPPLINLEFMLKNSPWDVKQEILKQLE